MIRFCVIFSALSAPTKASAGQARLAQLVEQPVYTGKVVGSSPASRTRPP